MTTALNWLKVRINFESKTRTSVYERIDEFISQHQCSGKSLISSKYSSKTLSRVLENKMYEISLLILLSILNSLFISLPFSKKYFNPFKCFQGFKYFRCQNKSRKTYGLCADQKKSICTWYRCLLVLPSNFLGIIPSHDNHLISCQSFCYMRRLLQSLPFSNKIFRI